MNLNQRVMLLLAVLAFAVALAIVIGNRLASDTAMAVALGVALGVIVGVPVGVGAAMYVMRGHSKSLGAVPTDEHHTTIVMPTEQADKLIQMVNSRRQASPDSFPLTAREREFTAVAGATLESHDEQP